MRKTTIFADTREQRPWKWPRPIQVKPRTFKTGDYSLYGFVDEIVVERKSESDLINCLYSDTERFEKQLARLAQFDYACVIVEGGLNSRRAPVTYADQVARCIHEWDVPIYFCSNRTAAAEFALHWMLHAAARVRMEWQADE